MCPGGGKHAAGAPFGIFFQVKHTCVGYDCVYVIPALPTHLPPNAGDAPEWSALLVPLPVSSLTHPVSSQGMRPGGKRTLLVPKELAPKGVSLPDGVMLQYEIELLEVLPGYF